MFTTRSMASTAEQARSLPVPTTGRSGSVLLGRPCEPLGGSAHTVSVAQIDAWHTAVVSLLKSTTTDAFVAIDLDEATTAHGVLRCAKKVLADGAWNLARSTTYAAAVYGLQISGASGGVNAEGDARDSAVAAFVAELSQRSTPPALALDAGKGVSAAELEPLRSADPRGGSADAQDLMAAGVVAGVAAVLGEMDGLTVAIEPAAPLTSLLSARFSAAGATIVDCDSDLTATCDVLVVGSKPGRVDHDVASGISARLIAPGGWLPVTARALAVARRAGIVVLPDFLCFGGPLLAGWGPAESDPEAVLVARMGEIVAVAGPHVDGLFLGACEVAEEFLASWATIPFGRPIP